MREYCIVGKCDRVEASCLTFFTKSHLSQIFSSVKAKSVVIGWSIAHEAIHLLAQYYAFAQKSCKGIKITLEHNSCAKKKKKNYNN